MNRSIGFTAVLMVLVGTVLSTGRELILGLKGRSYLRAGVQKFWVEVGARMEYRTSESDSRSRWYAVSTRSRQEKIAANTLEALGIAHFLPIQPQKRQWSDRIQTVHAPLFPGYLFVQIDPWSTARLNVLKVPGVARFVGGNTGPLAIENSEIEDIRRLVEGGMELAPHPFLKQGDRVRVVGGALAGVEGILTRIGTRLRVVISIEVIHRSLAITVSQNDIEPILSGVEKLRESA